jgi:SNF2 family DNA or RNA helicase
MLSLHAAWLSALGESPAWLALWGETDPEAGPRLAGRRRAGPHPFSASIELIRPQLPLADAPGESATLCAWLPTRGGAPVPARPIWGAPKGAGRGALALRAWAVPALTVAPLDAFAQLMRLPDEPAPGVDYGAGLLFWRAAARFALELLAGQRFLPALVEGENGARAVWQAVLEAPPDQARFDALAAAMPPAARAVTRAATDPEPTPRALLRDFLDTVTDAFARAEAPATTKRRGRASANRAPAERWLTALSAPDPAVDLPPDFVKPFQAWRHPAAAASDVRVCLRLDPPMTGVEAAGLHIPRPGARDWSLRYFLQPNDDPSLLVPADAVWRERGSTLRFLKRRFDQPQERLLAGLGQAARLCPPIEASLSEPRPEASALTAAEAHTFIREAALLLQASGFGVLLPGLSARLGVRVKLGTPAKKKTPTGGVARLTLESVVAFNWELALGDQPLTPAEFEQLAELKVPLVQIRGQWVEVQPEQLQQALAYLDRVQAAGTVTAEEALRLMLAPGELAGLPVTEVATEGALAELAQTLAGQAHIQPLPQPAAFRGQLRPYQAAGFAWLTFLRQFGLGACLADDMGLGKTIQTIAYLLHRRAQGERQPALLVCPTSVVGNWAREVARFGPSLRVLTHHGGARDTENFEREAARHDLVLTSYALLPRDEAALTAVSWGAVILDEAQNIKNPDTRQARAARRLKAAHRLALTGTPVENRLSELWSLFQFLNPGYLGSQASFRTTFARPIERLQDAEATRRLKALVGPLILRRVKTDPTVIDDLPAKNEMKVFCPLTREQATLYQAVVRDALQQIEAAEGVQRRGLVLGMMLRLKQVCNHPAQFLGDGSALADRSGKLNRLAEMLEEVRAVKERALIFTQFAEMGALLQARLQAAGDEVLFLHGGTPAKARTAMVERFQNDPRGPGLFILSIKAGGTGLNLTRANHVFHFDRWWNPAVENQATDRAFRIGQTRNVQVYKFICAGTMEERVDEMIERKSALASSIVGSSEAWITELSTAELRDVFALRAELAVAA